MANNTMTIKVTGKGHFMNDGSAPSEMGHMWYTLRDKNGNQTDYGLQPGKVVHNDGESYGIPSYEVTISLNQNQYDTLSKLKEESNKEPYKGVYDPWNYSCVDFVYEQLGTIGYPKFNGPKDSTQNDPINPFQPIPTKWPLGNAYMGNLLLTLGNGGAEIIDSHYNDVGSSVFNDAFRYFNDWREGLRKVLYPQDFGQVGLH